jgi:hypothetical protein
MTGQPGQPRQPRQPGQPGPAPGELAELTPAGSAGSALDSARTDILAATPRWEIYYAVTFAASVAIVEAGPISGSGRIVASVALAAIVPWYLLVGRPVILQGEPEWTAEAVRRGSVYLAGLVILFAIAQSQNPNTWFLAFAVCPQCWSVTSSRRASVFVVIFNVVAGPRWSGVTLGWPGR